MALLRHGSGSQAEAVEAEVEAAVKEKEAAEAEAAAAAEVGGGQSAAETIIQSWNRSSLAIQGKTYQVQEEL